MLGVDNYLDDTMHEEEKVALASALNTLILSPDAHELFQTLNDVFPLAQRAPIELTGDAAVLNPLLKLRLVNKEAYDRAVTLIEDRRKSHGYDPLVRVVERGYDKTQYMREFMDQKRNRQRRAAEIENMRRKERDRLVGNARLEFMRRQSERWKALRDQLIEQAVQECGGTLTKEQRQAILTKFWQSVDDDLDAKFEVARRAQLNPHSPVPEDDLRSLMEALNLPPR